MLLLFGGGKGKAESKLSTSAADLGDCGVRLLEEEQEQS